MFTEIPDPSNKADIVRRLLTGDARFWAGLIEVMDSLSSNRRAIRLADPLLIWHPGTS
jgi:hypothetical protein